MENYTRPYARLSIGLLLSGLVFLSCKGDQTNPPLAPESAATASQQDQSPGKNDGEITAADLNLPENVSVGEKQVIAGEIKDFGDRDLATEGAQHGNNERTADFTGFAGVSPCDVITPQDLAEWPGGIGNVSSERNNVGEIVLGCIYTFYPSPGKAGGVINVYFSDNQNPELAAESVATMGKNGVAKAITDWELPAAYDPNTGEFVWSRGKNFITLQIAHPAINADQEAWTRKIASKINSRL